MKTKQILNPELLLKSYVEKTMLIVESLSKHCKDIHKKLYPVYKESPELLERRRAVAYICLIDSVWDAQPSGEDAWKKVDAKLKKKIIKDIREEIEDDGGDEGKVQQQSVREIVYGICKRRKEIRDLLFQADRVVLGHCKTKTDVERFIVDYPHTFPDFLLVARKVTGLPDRVFEELSVAMKASSEIDWEEVLRTNCRSSKAGIEYVASMHFDSIDNNKAIEDYLDCFVKLELADGQCLLVCQNLVTEQLWNVVMQQVPLFNSDMDIPRLMSYEEAVGFVNELRHLVCVEFRMPTVEEWEKCALAGEDDNSHYSGGNEIDEYAIYSENSGFVMQPIKSKKPNRLGLYDMCGNAWEWCQSESEKSSKAPIKGGDFTSPREWCEIRTTKHVLKTSFAGCRLVLDCCHFL